MATDITMTSRARETLLDLLEQYLPNTTIWAYGSRVKGKARRPQTSAWWRFRLRSKECKLAISMRRFKRVTCLSG